MQSIDTIIKDSCKKDGHDVKKLPFKPEEYNLVTQKSTFLDIGSGFGKPNFHVALQVFPKESIGVEVVEARVSYSIDQRYKFEEHYLRLKSKKEAASFSNISNTSSCVANCLSQGGQNNDDQIKQLKKVNFQVDNLESSLRVHSLIKGNANAL